mgnify:CR=1 FL=1
MTFKEFIDKIEREREHCRDEFDTYKSVKDYLQMGHYIAIVRAYDWVLELAKDVEIGEEKHNDFSWDNVKIGDKCINGDYTGIVSRLIFDSDGYCCGMVVNFSDEFGNKWKDISQDDEYKLYKQIGSWAHE